MITSINSQIATYALASFPDNFSLPTATYGDRGEEQWYLDFPEELIDLEYFRSQDYNLLPGQSVTTNATIYQYRSTSIRPNAYAFFDIGTYSYLDGEAAAVYMVIVAKYFATDTIGTGSNTYLNSVATYGVAYYVCSSLQDDGFYAKRLSLGYTSPIVPLPSNGILSTLYNIGQYLVEHTDSVIDLLNLKVLGIRLWQILFGGIGGGFIVYAGYCITKWIIP